MFYRNLIINTFITGHAGSITPEQISSVRKILKEKKIDNIYYTSDSGIVCDVIAVAKDFGIPSSLVREDLEKINGCDYSILFPYSKVKTRDPNTWYIEKFLNNKKIIIFSNGEILC